MKIELHKIYLAESQPNSYLSFMPHDTHECSNGTKIWIVAIRYFDPEYNFSIDAMPVAEEFLAQSVKGVTEVEGGVLFDRLSEHAQKLKDMFEKMKIDTYFTHPMEDIVEMIKPAIGHKEGIYPMIFPTNKEALENNDLL